MNIMISACLLGYKVRYDGSDKLNQELIDILKDHILIPICPEYLAGFSIPHPPIEYKDGAIFIVFYGHYAFFAYNKPNKKKSTYPNTRRIRICVLILINDYRPEIL